MKIVHISIYPLKGEKHSNAGGVASYTKNLITKIPYQNNDEVFVLCNKVNNKIEKYSENGINVIRCFDKNPKFFFQLLKEIKKIKPDVIHIQQELALFGGTITAYLLQWLLFSLKKYRLIITLHGVVSLKKINKDFIRENNSSLPIWLTNAAFRVIYTPLCWWAKKVIVHENVFKNILIDEYGIKAEKIAVIHHGIEDFISIDKDLACQKLGLDHTKDIVLFMGYLTGYKGIDLLIEGFSEYAKVNKNAFLVIGAGKHPKLKNDEDYLKEYGRLKDKAEQMIPANQYKWTGFIKESEITTYYSAADVSIYPYTIQMSSSGPMSIAIGHSKPFLVSEVFSETFSDKGFIFENNVEGFSKKVINFFDNKREFDKKVEKLKKERLWKMVGKKIKLIYIKK